MHRDDSTIPLTTTMTADVVDRGLISRRRLELTLDPTTIGEPTRGGPS